MGGLIRNPAQADDLSAIGVEPGVCDLEAEVTVGEMVDEGGISRDDVAAALHAVLHAPNTIGITFGLIAGDTPVERPWRRSERPRPHARA